MRLELLSKHSAPHPQPHSLLPALRPSNHGSHILHLMPASLGLWGSLPLGHRYLPRKPLSVPGFAPRAPPQGDSA